MMYNFQIYNGLQEGLVKFPVPDEVNIGRRRYNVPKTLAEFSKNICYGQRLFFTRKEDNDFGIILRMIDGYYYPIVSGKKWDEENALLCGKIVLTCKVVEIYPVSMHLVTLISELVDREHKLLHREPSKMELAAGIEKLNVYAELNALDFLRDAMKVTVPEVLLTPYDECLVRFMIAKETAQFQERYFELSKENANIKKQPHGKS